MKNTSKKDLEKLKKMLRTARNKYDNELLKIEKVWSLLKPGEYTHRESLVKVAKEMIEIDQDLKKWEDKISRT